MNPRQRLLTTLRGELPDCVPVAPDFSNMIPAKLTGKPFWDLYLYNDPPIWEAYIACAKYFDIDALMDGYFPLSFPQADGDQAGWQDYIVSEDAGRIVTQAMRARRHGPQWAGRVNVYYVADPPTNNVPPEKIGLPAVPQSWRSLQGVRPVDTGPEGLRRVVQLLGEQGLVGVFLAGSAVLGSIQDVYDYYDSSEKARQAWAEQRLEAVERRFAQIMALPVKPDFLCVGGSGTLVFQTVKIFRQLAFPAVRRGIELAAQAGIPTHVHSCGPEKKLVQIMAEETGLTVIDPLEIPPMGDCHLAEIKRLYGGKLTLKGNLHTTQIMLRGTPEDVRRASRQAIDDAAAGGRFILSTGDQCGRDTPFENLRAMVETAREYGRY